MKSRKIANVNKPICICITCLLTFVFLKEIPGPLIIRFRRPTDLTFDLTKETTHLLLVRFSQNMTAQRRDESKGDNEWRTTFWWWRSYLSKSEKKITVWQLLTERRRQRKKDLDLGFRIFRLFLSIHANSPAHTNERFVVVKFHTIQTGNAI